MTDYKLIAFDMDGTLLNSNKKLTQNTIDTIRKCIHSGKYIVFSTGRCLPELKEFTDLLPEVQYLICTSGSFVYDPRKEQEIYSCPLSVETCQKIFAQVEDMDIMIHLMGKKSIVQKDKIPCMQDYNMIAYQPMYYQVTTPVEDIRAFYRQNPMPVHKLNLYCKTLEDRQIIRERLSSLELNVVNAETTSLECSAIGATKGEGLVKLCEYLRFHWKKPSQ